MGKLSAITQRAKADPTVAGNGVCGSGLRQRMKVTIRYSRIAYGRKPQDVVVALKLCLERVRRSLAELGEIKG